MTGSALGYYLVHSCSDPSDHADQCDGVFVWSDSAPSAVSRDPERRDPEVLEATRQPEADRYREILGDRVGNGWGRQGPDADRAYRAIWFSEDGSESCDTCGLHEFDSVPESAVCCDCLQCGECGCSCPAVGDEVTRQIANGSCASGTRSASSASTVRSTWTRPAAASSGAWSWSGLCGVVATALPMARTTTAVSTSRRSRS